jgi:hypothetical protein
MVYRLHGIIFISMGIKTLNLYFVWVSEFNNWSAGPVSDPVFLIQDTTGRFLFFHPLQPHQVTKCSHAVQDGLEAAPTSWLWGTVGPGAQNGRFLPKSPGCGSVRRIQGNSGSHPSQVNLPVGCEWGIPCCPSSLVSLRTSSASSECAYNRSSRAG